MPGTTEETGTVRAVKLSEYASLYPHMHVVIVSKSTKADAGTDQLTDYLFNGYVQLKDTNHPDLVVVGKPLGSPNGDPQTEWLAQRREELELANMTQVKGEKGDKVDIIEMLKSTDPSNES